MSASALQLRLLSRLSLERAETFTFPRSEAEASREIRRLLSRKRDHGSKRKKARPGRL